MQPNIHLRISHLMPPVFTLEGLDDNEIQFYHSKTLIKEPQCIYMLTMPLTPIV